MPRILQSSVWMLVLAAAILWAATATTRHNALVPEDNPVQATTEPAFTVDINDLDDAVSCPVAVPQATETVLLIHGTGMTPQLNWDTTLLPPLLHAQTYQPCYVALPQRLLADIQLSAEYISHAIKTVAAQAQTQTQTQVQAQAQAQQEHGQISLISWSAGALATQWTLTFYPDTRARVKRHIALGADYRGSWSMVPMAYLNMYTPAVIQQLPGSGLLTALARFGGGRACVPTTNIGSSTDLVVQPGFYGEGWGRFESGLGFRFRDSWRLGGPLASNVDLVKVCAGAAVRNRSWPRVWGFSHEALLWDPASHRVVFDALANDESFLGKGDVVGLADCRGGRAPFLHSGLQRSHAAIMPGLVDYASKLPVAGWPEVPLREYTRG